MKLIEEDIKSMEPKYKISHNINLDYMKQIFAVTLQIIKIYIEQLMQ